MRVVLHPKVPSDVRTIMEYYRNVAGPSLADEFYRELRQLILRAAEQPGSFAARERDRRPWRLPVGKINPAAAASPAGTPSP